MSAPTPRPSASDRVCRAEQRPEREELGAWREQFTDPQQREVTDSFAEEGDIISAGGALRREEWIDSEIQILCW